MSRIRGTQLVIADLPEPVVATRSRMRVRDVLRSLPLDPDPADRVVDLEAHRPGRATAVPAPRPAREQERVSSRA